MRGLWFIPQPAQWVMNTRVLTALTAVLGLFGCYVLFTENKFFVNLYVGVSAILLIAVTVGGIIEIQRKSKEKLESKDISAFNSYIQQKRKSV